MAELKDILVPDIGDFSGVEVIEIIVSPGDTVSIEDPLVSLESDKAAMEIPAEFAGVIKEIKISLGDKISEGDLMMTMEVSGEAAAAAPAEEKKAEPKKEAQKAAAPAAAKPAPAPQRAAPVPTAIDEASFSTAHASPAVRKFARELGANLGQINGSGPKSRILKEDVKSFVKQVLTSGAIGAPSGGLSVEPMPEIDFSKFGEIETQALTKINKLPR